MMIDFITDHLVEKSGFNITYKIFSEVSLAPEDLMPSIGDVSR